MFFAHMLASCGDEQSTKAPEKGTLSVKEFAELGACDKNAFGEEIFVEDSAKTFYCNGKKWQYLNEEVNDATKRDSLSNKEISSSSIEQATESSSSADTLSISDDGKFILDLRDGKSYKIVTIGKQTWMAENLAYAIEGSFCHYENSASCLKYGKMYTWQAANNACPNGTHLPSVREWEQLFETIGGLDSAGAKLKSKTGWAENGNGSDSYGFGILPAGSTHKDNDANFYSEGVNAFFWTSTKVNEDEALFQNFDYSFARANNRKGSTGYAYSVRCILNKEADSVIVDLSSSSAKDSIILSSSSAKDSIVIIVSSSSAILSSSSSSTIIKPELIC